MTAEGKTRVLLVDDEIGVTRLLKLNLEHTGSYDVAVQNRGARALDAARGFRPHIILLDIVMPDLGGVEVAAQIRADERLKHVPIVFLTAVVVKGAGSVLHGHPVLSKPANLHTVVTCIERQLQACVPAHHEVS